MKTKLCRSCHKDLALDAFASHIRNKDKKQTQCKECMNALTRNWWKNVGSERYAGKRRGSKLGLSLGQVENMIKQANGNCACCKRKTDKLYIDHNHATGAIRGMLCNSCNVGIGFIEMQNFLEAASEYLRKFV